MLSSSGSKITPNIFLEMDHKFLNNAFWGDKHWIKILQQWRNKWPFFPIHWKSFPGSARNHHKLCISLFRGAGFRHRFCSSWVVLPHLLPGEFVLLFPCVAEMFVHPGRMERGRRQSQPWPGALLVLGTEHSKWSCHNSLLKICRDENFVELTGIPQRGKRSMTGGVSGGCCFLRWMEACPPHVATNAGHSSGPNYSPKEHPQLLESVILLFPPMFLPGRRIENSSCSSKNVQMMSHSWWSTGQHQVKKVFPSRFFFFFLNFTPQQLSELQRQVQIRNRLEACPGAVSTRGDGEAASGVGVEPNSQGEVVLLSAGRLYVRSTSLPCWESCSPALLLLLLCFWPFCFTGFEGLMGGKQS